MAHPARAESFKVSALRLQVKKLHPKAKLPTVAHPGEDLGFDIYALHDTLLLKHQVTRLSTGIAVELSGYGFLLRERSSLALEGICLSGGVIDAGYRGEILVNLTYRAGDSAPDQLRVLAGEKVAQMIPMLPFTHIVPQWAKSLSDSSRGSNGYGSSGK